GGEAPGRLCELSPHAIVNRVDARGRLDHRVLVAERQREHRADGGPQSRNPGRQAAAEAAVLADAGRNQRVGELEQDCPSPGGNYDHLAVDAPADVPGARTCAVPLAKPRPDGVAVLLDRSHGCCAFSAIRTRRTSHGRQHYIARTASLERGVTSA